MLTPVRSQVVIVNSLFRDEFVCAILGNLLSFRFPCSTSEEKRGKPSPSYPFGILPFNSSCAGKQAHMITVVCGRTNSYPTSNPTVGRKAIWKAARYAARLQTGARSVVA